MWPARCAPRWAWGRIAAQWRLSRDWGFQLSYLLGVLITLLGVLLIVRADAMIAIFGALVGLALAADSVVKLQMSLRMRAFGLPRWKALAIGAAALFVLGRRAAVRPVRRRHGHDRRHGRDARARRGGRYLDHRGAARPRRAVTAAAVQPPKREHVRHGVRAERAARHAPQGARVDAVVKEEAPEHLFERPRLPVAVGAHRVFQVARPRLQRGEAARPAGADVAPRCPPRRRPLPK